MLFYLGVVDGSWIELLGWTEMSSNHEKKNEIFVIEINAK